MGNRIDITGKRNGMLVAVELLPERPKNHHAMWRCLCDCGKEFVVRGSRFASGMHSSCGCNRGWHGRTHGQGFKKTRPYIIWKNMRQRCLNPRTPAYRYYGARGIVICDRWLNSFEAFYSDMGEPPTAKHSLDRIDNDGNYEPGNCRWATELLQSQNRRTTQWLTHNGETLPVSEWARRAGLRPVTLRSRLARGWDVSTALSQGVHAH